MLKRVLCPYACLFVDFLVSLIASSRFVLVFHPLFSRFRRRRSRAYIQTIIRRRLPRSAYAPKYVDSRTPRLSPRSLLTPSLYFSFDPPVLPL